jgi:hypothetical protein
MTMAMPVIVVAPVMSVRLPMAVIVIFSVPVPFVVSPPILIVVVVRVRPKCPLVGWFLVASGHPAVVVTLRRPEAAHPDHPDSGRRRRGWLIRYWWRRNPDIYGNLSRCGNREGHPKKKRDQTSVFHACPPSDVETGVLDHGNSLPVKHSIADITDAASIAQWRFSGIAGTTSRADLKEQYGQLVGGEARCPVSCAAGAHGCGVKASAGDFVFEH